MEPMTRPLSFEAIRSSGRLDFGSRLDRRVQVLHQRLYVDAVSQCALLDILKARNGTAKAHQPVRKEHWDGLRVLLYHLSDRHTLRDCHYSPLS